MKFYTRYRTGMTRDQSPRSVHVQSLSIQECKPAISNGFNWYTFNCPRNSWIRWVLSTYHCTKLFIEKYINANWNGNCIRRVCWAVTKKLNEMAKIWLSKERHFLSITLLARREPLPVNGLEGILAEKNGGKSTFIALQWAKTKRFNFI